MVRKIDPDRIEVVDEAVAEILRRMTPVDRLQIAFRLRRRARDLIQTNVRSEHPDWDDAQVVAAVARRMSHGTG